MLVRALGSLDRGAPVALPVVTDAQTVKEDDLHDALNDVQAALSAPVRLTLGPTRWRLPRWKIAPILDLPDHGSTTLGLGGPGEQKWFKRLAGTVDREPRDATWAVGEHIRVIPDRPGVLIERKATEQAVLSALLSSDNRLAKISVTSLAPSRTTKQAKGMGIVGLVGSYETIYGGDANRINNVQLVSHLIDGTLVGPGATFSFNGTTGERTEEKGFKEAPVIINGELGTGIAGGVCQVSTTVFNAAYEGGLEITERHNHALYISHYPTRPRRDRELPRPRPQVRQRHVALAAAADVRRLRLAGRQPVRHAGRPPRRHRDVTAQGRRAGPGRAGRRSRQLQGAQLRRGVRACRRRR